MKRKFFILTIICLALLFVLFPLCKKNNTVTDNNPPNTPSAPQISVDTSEIGKKVFFSVFANDPDNDSVAFRFDWSHGDTSSWYDFVPSGDTISMYHSFGSEGTFYIRVQVKDIYEGLSDWSEPDSIVIQDSTWTLVWTCATPSAPWSPRISPAVVFDNKIWVFGGGGLDTIKNDVWYSSDGVNWIRATESAQWSQREAHTSVIFDNKMWVLGGVNLDEDRLNDVWYSSDGVNWTCATESAGWPDRLGHTSVVFDNKIWVISGWGSNPPCYKDVWYSNDGINWTCATEAAAWRPRMWPTSLVLDNKIWMLGGSDQYGLYGLDFCDVWNSADGTNWNCITDSAGWSARCGHTSAILDNKVWVMGGLAFDSLPGQSGWWAHNDIWYVDVDTLIRWNPTNPKAPWHCLTDSAPWPSREYFASVVFNNKIWVIGGSSGAVALNDVWYGEIVHGKR